MTDTISSSEAKGRVLYYYVVHTDHHFLYQGIHLEPTPCGALAMNHLRDLAAANPRELVLVGRFLVQRTWPIHLVALVVASPLLAPGLVEVEGAADLSPSDRTLQKAVMGAVSAQVGEARRCLRLAWIPEFDDKREEEDFSELADEDCVCSGRQSVVVGSWPAAQ